MFPNALYNKTQLWLIFFLLLACVTAVYAGDVALEKIGELHIGGRASKGKFIVFTAI